VLAFAAADAAKVEAQRRVSRLPQCRKDRIDDVVEHRAAVERMRMTDDCGSRVAAGIGEQTFQRRIAGSKRDLGFIHRASP
jgi:hypothetical protein